LQRLIQALSLILFLILLWLTAFPLAQSLIPVDLFLRLDPLVGVLIPLSSRAWISNFIPALVLLFAAFAVGRIFCGYICPMGTTLDMARSLSASRNGRHSLPCLSPTLAPALKHLKYLILIVFIAAALFGINLIFWGSPIALITRFYSLLVHPLLTLLGSEGLNLARPLADSFDLTSLSYMQVASRRFDSVYFLLALFGLLFFLERIRPRFWCRYLCPAGALFGLFSLRPLWRRRVHECIRCGRCIVDCPTGAILPQATDTAHAECITCRSCVGICPVHGIRFAVSEVPAKNLPFAPDMLVDEQSAPLLPSRRAFLAATALGAGLASLGYISNASPLTVGARGTLRQTGLIRPPGSRPEKDFLRRCLRCAQCMKACPTGGLQPVWFASGVEGMFSPALVSRTGPCEPECSLCGAVCPSQAIVSLPLQEKQQAKIGTAVVQPNLCLAWAEGRSCVVCQEVCPYGAISLEQAPGANVPVPIVKAQRCFGCGYCEYHCPVFLPAITAQPLNALRLAHGQYKAEAKLLGLDLMPVAERPPMPEAPEAIPAGDLPPGFTE